MRGRNMLGRAAWLAAVLSLTQSTARASDTTVHVTGRLGVSYSDNVLAAPDPPPPGLAGPIKDVLVEYAAGAALLHATPSVQLIFTYAHPIIFYAAHPGADTSADVAVGQGRFQPTPYDNLLVRLDLGRMRSNLSTLSAAGQTAIAAQRGGDSTLFVVGLMNEYSRELSPRWSLLQTGTSGLSLPVGGGASLLSLGLTAGPQLSFDHHVLGALASLAYSRPLGDAAAGFTRDQWVVGSRLRWAWSFAPPDWSAEVTAGAAAAIEGSEVEAQPVGSATVAYALDGFGASLTYDRSYTPNLLTAQTYFSDSVSLRGNLPILAEQRLRGQSSVGFAYSRAIDLARDTAVRVKTVVADVALGWYPESYPQIEVRYQYSRQFDAPEGQLLLPNFNRNLVALVVSYAFPPIRPQPSTTPTTSSESGEGQ